jgi:hydrogenase expression/formation protein HypE
VRFIINTDLNNAFSGRNNVNKSIKFSCPIPADSQNVVTIADGGGGKETWRLLNRVFFPAFAAAGNLDEAGHDAHDGAVIDGHAGPLAVTTDSFVVRPLFFPGGDIGTLAVFGSVNDLAMCGARPIALSAAFIIEENFSVSNLKKISASMCLAAEKANVRIVTGDTKVVEKGKCDGLYISTTGVGIVESNTKICPGAVQLGDVIILSGDVGRHAAAILSAREELSFSGGIDSDCDCLVDPVMQLLAEGVTIHCLRDLTRGGLAAALNEISDQSGLSIRIREQNIPVHDSVRGLCEMLGFDPLQLANEGRFICILPADQAQKALSLLKQFDVTNRACIIGDVVSADFPIVEIETVLKTRRILDMPSGQLLPRIC